jgi:hypothetical protein
MDCMEKTWLPFIQCKNLKCNVKPKANYAPIRKTQRLDPEKIRKKVELAIQRWNDGSLDFKNEGFEIDYEKIVEDFKNKKLGLPGFRQE